MIILHPSFILTSLVQAMARSRELSLQSVITQYQQQQASLQQDHRTELAELEVRFCLRFVTIVQS
jgi:hypothetical protein